jgi:predicted RNase H-like nuclease (RuvC/YqgF family)
MKRSLLRIVALLLMVTLIAGCATTDSGRTKAQGAGFGALLLGTVGGIVGAVLGGEKGAAIGAAAGVALGAAAGYAVGSCVASRKEKYANEEDRLDGETNVVTGYNNDLQACNQKVDSQIKELELQVADIKSQYDDGKISLVALENKQKEINSMVQKNEKLKNDMDNEVVALNDYRESIAQTQDQTKVAKLGDEIDTLKKNITALDDGNKQMAQLVSSLTVRR